jgi:hypothetical protein
MASKRAKHALAQAARRIECTSRRERDSITLPAPFEQLSNGGFVKGIATRHVEFYNGTSTRRRMSPRLGSPVLTQSEQRAMRCAANPALVTPECYDRCFEH